MNFALTWTLYTKKIIVSSSVIHVNGYVLAAPFMSFTLDSKTKRKRHICTETKIYAIWAEL